LMDELLKPEVRALDPYGIDDMRSRAASLLCSHFLLHLQCLLNWEGFLLLWIQILNSLSNYYRTGNEILIEAIPESLKNVLLVLSASGAFPENPYEKSEGQLEGDSLKQKVIWDSTWEHIEPFLPDLRIELFPIPEVKIEVAEQTEEVKSEEVKPEEKPDENQKHL